jgi:replication factor A1
MTAEDIIGRIVSTCPGISKEQIVNRLESERRRTGGFISDEALLRVIAAEFGCAIPSIQEFMPALAFGDLISGLNNVTVVGRVVAAFSPRAFSGVRSGKFASLLIADKSGILRIVLWNDKANLIESGKLRVGQIVRFSHGYTREDYTGKIELHIGERCEVELNPHDVEAKDFPTISRFATRIGELTHAVRNKKVNVAGTVKELFAISNFERQDLSSGRVMRFVLADGLSEIVVVVWNEKVDELEKLLKVGVRLQIVNAKVKKAMGEGLEIHVDAMTYVGTVPPAERFMKIADLKQGASDVDVEGEVATKPLTRDVRSSNQELLKLATFELQDETGRIWVSAWRNHAESVKTLKVGDKVIIENAYVKRGFGDQLELGTRNTTSIVKKQDGEPS